MAPMTIPVLKDALNFGVPYETTTAATLSLHHCRVEGMWLARNVDKFKTLDDIVIYGPRIENNGTNLTYLIQVKYKGDRGIIECNEFISYKKDDQFSLEKFLDDYKELFRKVERIVGKNTIYAHIRREQKNVRFILHTNRAVAKCDFLEVVDHRFYYANLIGKLYKFKTEKLVTYQSLKKKMDLRFFRNLFLCCEKVTSKDFRNVLTGEFTNIVKEAGCETMHLDTDHLRNSAILYKDFFWEWETCLLNTKPLENYPLSNNLIITKVTQVLLNNFAFKFKTIPSEKLDICNIEMWNSLLSREVIIIDPHERIYPLLKHYVTTDQSYKQKRKVENCKIFHENGSKSHSHWCYWMHKFSPLVLQIYERGHMMDVFKIIGLSQYSLKVIVINSTANRNCTDVVRDIVQICGHVDVNCCGDSNRKHSEELIRYVSSSELLPQGFTVNGHEPLITQSDEVDKVANILEKTICENMDLIHAMKNKQIDKIIELINNNNISVNAKDKSGKTALHYATWHSLPQHIAEQLLKHRANVNEKDASGKTPLHLAVDADSMDSAEYLLKRGAAIDEADDEKKTPLHHATRNGCTEVVELLLSRRANPDVPDDLGRTPLYVAVDRQNSDLVALLLKHDASMEIRYEGGNTILHRAVLKGSKEIVQLLLTKEIDIDAVNLCGQTALHLACSNGPKKAFGRKVDSAAVLKCVENYGDITEVLLENKADVAVEDCFGKTGLDYIEELKRSVICYLDEESINNSDKDAQCYASNRPAILQCYENVAFSMSN